jgi:HEPN domain.
MSFNWQLYLDLAYELIEHQKEKRLEEAYLRSAISRSYHGAFCTIRNLLREKGKQIPKKDTHKFVINYYKNSADLKERQIGLSLDRLRIARIDSDYEDNAEINFNKARLVYLMSYHLLQEV